MKRDKMPHSAAPARGAHFTQRMLGPWPLRVSHRWEPDDAVKKLLEQKCSHFMALLSGDWIKNTFKAWAEQTRKNKRAKQRWLNRALSNCFDLWFDDVFVEAAELYLKVQKQCSKVVAMIGGEMRSACFHSWQQHSAKMSKSRRFLQRIVKGRLYQSSALLSIHIAYKCMEWVYVAKVCLMGHWRLRFL